MMSYYPYRFVMNYKGGVDDPYAQKILYTFNSPRSHQGYMATYVSEEHFEHRFNIKKSTYILLRRKAMQENPNLEHQIQERSIQLYPYFE